jgi:hypothetical protein
MLVIDRARHAVREVIVFWRSAGFPVVPGAFRVDGVHPPELFDSFPQRIFFCHVIILLRHVTGATEVAPYTVAPHIVAPYVILGSRG